MVTAPSGAAALETLASTPVDLVVSDFRMPSMDGLEFLREVQTLRPDVPRILMTAFPDIQLAVDALNQASIRRFLTKPIDPDHLLQAVGDLLSEQLRRRQRESAFARSTKGQPDR